MSLFNKIESDLKEAMKARETERLAVLRMLKSAAKYAAIEKHGADGLPTDEEVVAVIRKEIKKRQDSVESFEKAGRAELVENEKREAEVLKGYLPKELDESEIQTIVNDAIQEVGAQTKAQMGAVMKIAQEKAAGRVDGKTLSQFVARSLK